MAEVARFEEIALEAQEVLDCSFSKWAPLFRENVFPYRIISPLAEAFLKYLLSDGIELPSSKEAKVVLERNSDNEYSDWEEEEEEETKIEEVGGEKASGDACISALYEQVSRDIKDLGGSVIPKLNWSSPKDARWLMPGNIIRCTGVDDVLLLLKSSDHITDDLVDPFSEVQSGSSSSGSSSSVPSVEYELVLKQWQDINPALEFRVFVRDGKILGVTQRDLNHYDFLKDLHSQLKAKIDAFVTVEAIPRLDASLPELKKYTLDVYIPEPFEKVYIIDVNPFSRKSDSYLFTWNELLTKNVTKDYEMRLINETNMGAFAKTQFSESKVPIDVVGASHDTETLIELAREWRKLQTNGSLGEDD
ncbi:uncharacterized protein LODBEIA_P48440 [Lodderomyces beijingensis]|uniref:Cell division cycle protein 123 n=1 Tax=Lodderomyces beijingensis TaxID=1775926 RepID=A0ABP0ZVU9_9ASCO